MKTRAGNKIKLLLDPHVLILLKYYEIFLEFRVTETDVYFQDTLFPLDDDDRRSNLARKACQAALCLLRKWENFLIGIRRSLRPLAS